MAGDCWRYTLAITGTHRSCRMHNEVQRVDFPHFESGLRAPLCVTGNKTNQDRTMASWSNQVCQEDEPVNARGAAEVACSAVPRRVKGIAGRCYSFHETRPGTRLASPAARYIVWRAGGGEHVQPSWDVGLAITRPVCHPYRGCWKAQRRAPPSFPPTKHTSLFPRIGS